MGRRRNQQNKREQQRQLVANDRECNRKYKYVNNFVKTSKYSLLTFLPINLLEQFKRLANFYFLCLMIIQYIPAISSLKPYTTIFPLIFVLSVSAIKDAYDDIQRHRSDFKVNNRKSIVVQDGKTKEEKWQYVQVGDVVRMVNGDFVAADVLLLSTSEPDGMCYIETAELDGETNLKAKQALPETAAMEDDLWKLSAFNGEIFFGPPSKLLPPVPEAFCGRMQWGQNAYALDNDKMLLRGCVLRNTKWCYGVVVFAGRDTKLMMNSGKAHFKRTSLDGFMNVLIIGIILFLASMCLICACLCGLWEYVYGPTFEIRFIPRDHDMTHKITDPYEILFFIAFLAFFSYLILLNTVVPISLYVSVEIIRFWHSIFINWDREMFYEKTNTCAMARTTTLNEELGQIQYIFSDKTGTLTQNIMTFNKCSINGCMYGDVVDECENVIPPSELEPLNFAHNQWSEEKFCWYDESLVEATANQSIVQTFWRLLALCHTVMPEWKDDSKLEYQAQSPDEAALVGAARNFGFVFKSRNTNSITIETPDGQEETYELLAILEFDNVRKRMSVLVRRNGLVTLFCKGADMVVLPRLNRSHQGESLKIVTQSHLDAFASEGLRTLCLAYKIVDNQFFVDWMRRQKETSTAMENRKEKLAELYEEMERNMILIGATAIEDKLQDGVPETIANLAKAKIKIWVLTGDKQETAVNIGYSSHLLTQLMRNIFVINSHQFDVVRQKLEEAKAELHDYKLSMEPKPIVPQENGAANPNITRPIVMSVISSATIFYDTDEPPDDGTALVIDGHSLVHALDKKLEMLFLKVARQCQTVICCRVTPSQKAAVVNLVKKHEKAITLAIGDGANDVPMIKSAHIGVGISGQEGMQAVLASDYSIAQFRFLERLLLVHGRWSYFRMAKFMRYFFYKNFAFTLVQFWYCFHCGFSAQTLYDAILLTCYNLLFTSLPVLALGILDQDVDDKNSTKYPLLYTPGPANRFFNMRVFAQSLMHGIFTSLALVFVARWTSIDTVDSHGRNNDDLSTFGFTVISSLVVSVTGQVAMDTSYWTYLNFLSIFLSLFFLFAVPIVYFEAFPYAWILKMGYGSTYGSAFFAMKTSVYWFNILLVSAVTLAPVLAIRYFYNTTQPSLTHKVRAKQRLERYQQIVEPEKLPCEEGPARQDRLISQATIGSSVFAPSPPPTPRQRPPYRTHRKQTSTFSMPAASPPPWDDRRRGSRMRTESIRSGYAFSHEHGFGERITSGVLRMHSQPFGGSLRMKQIDENGKRNLDMDSPSGDKSSKRERSPLASDDSRGKKF